MTGPLVLTDPLPAGWVRCPELGCGARVGHEPPCVPEAVPAPPEDTGRAGVAALAGPEVDVAAELSATVSAKPIAVSATRYERIEAAARAHVAAVRAVQATPTVSADFAAAVARGGATLEALRAALCTCNAHGPDPACVDHGAAIARWQKENGT